VEDTAVPVSSYQGDALTVKVGSPGGAGTGNGGDDGTGGAGGSPGGGPGGDYPSALDNGGGGGGGGYSGLLDPPSAPLVIAGGGGGGGSEETDPGYAAGGAGDTGTGGGTGGDGYASDAHGGTGALGSTPGLGGLGEFGLTSGNDIGGNGGNGASLSGGQGGASGQNPNAGGSSGGGGGGGYYGGGGGGGGRASAGGGGGSSYGAGPGLTNEKTAPGAAEVVISYTLPLASPSISTSQQPASAAVGSSIADKATVSGGDSPSGTVTFVLYSNSTASGTPLFTDADVALSSGSATSTSYTTAATGTDYWVATYNGDTNNNSVSSGDSAEPVSVTAVPPSVTLATPPSVTATYTYGQVVDASYSCTAGAGSTLKACSGTVTNGSPINTTSIGSNSFKVTATDADNQATSVTHTYNVVAASTSLRAWPQLVELEPFVGVGSQTVQATLTSGGSPVAGQTVYFTDGSTALCHATTNGAGVARCYISWNDQALLYLTNHYTATFGTTTDYTGSTSTTLVVTFIL